LNRASQHARGATKNQVTWISQQNDHISAEMYSLEFFSILPVSRILKQIVGFYEMFKGNHHRMEQ